MVPIFATNIFPIWLFFLLQFIRVNVRTPLKDISIMETVYHHPQGCIFKFSIILSTSKIKDLLQKPWPVKIIFQSCIIISFVTKQNFLEELYKAHNMLRQFWCFFWWHSRSSNESSCLYRKISINANSKQSTFVLATFRTPWILPLHRVPKSENLRTQEAGPENRIEKYLELS